jgi:hypothetical protein
MVKEALMNTASMHNKPNNIYGWGIIDTIAALNYLPKVQGMCSNIVRIIIKLEQVMAVHVLLVVLMASVCACLSIMARIVILAEVS